MYLRKLICLLAFFNTSSFLAATHNFANVPNPYENKHLIYQPVYGPGNYLQYANYINSSDIKLIFEIGSRDAIDAIQLGYYYKCPVFAFECNPPALEISYHNIQDYPYVTMVPHACWNETKPLPFYPVILSHNGAYPVNIGASSLLVARKDGCDSHHIQGNPIIVQGVRLDEWMDEQQIGQVDLICMDTQGATLQVLQGLGKYLSKVKYIITEVYLSPSFVGEALYPEIKEWLEKRGFRVAQEPAGGPFSDVLFINYSMDDEDRNGTIRNDN